MTTIPNEVPIALFMGDTVTITEEVAPNVALLPADSTTVTLASGTNTVTVVDPPAVRIKKTCATGVSGKATFTVMNG